jgi:hypothetical protein
MKAILKITRYEGYTQGYKIWRLYSRLQDMKVILKLTKYEGYTQGYKKYFAHTYLKNAMR